MKIENLKDGMKVKNYKELCKILEIEMLTSNSKKAQIKDLERLCEFRRSGHSFIIDKIRDIPLERVENRGKSSKVNNSIYIEDIENILLYIMNYQDKNKLTISKPKALELVNIVNDRYNYGRQNMKSEAKALGIDEIYISDFFLNNHSQLTNTFERSLRSMKNKGLIIWETRYYVKDEKSYRLATNKEKQLIADYQHVMLQLNGCETLSQAFLNGVLKNIKSSVVDSINNELGTSILFYYEGYEINISKMGIEREIDKMKAERSMENINLNIALKIIKATEKRKLNTENRISKVGAVNDYDKMKSTDEYINVHAELVDRYILN